MSSASFWLVLIETSGNQRHIFETNKLAENVGASEQLYRLGTTDVLEAIRRVFPDSMSALLTADDVHDPGINCRIEEVATQIEVWYLSSGKALLFVRDRDAGRKVVQHVTRTAAFSYPGVVVRGAIQEICNFTVEGLSATVRAIHENVEGKRSTLPPEERRFQRIPVVAECRNSGLPAAGIISEGKQLIDVSAVSAAKRGGVDCKLQEEWRESIRKRMSDVIPKELLGAHTLDHLETWLDEMRYVAVVHADGNGVGKIFRDFPNLAGCSTAREFTDSLRRFSRGIDECTKAAFHDAVDLVCKSGPQFTTIDPGKRELKVPVLPLIAGGDDVTLLTTAEFAMAFVPVFLRRLEEKIDQHVAVAPIAKRASGVRRLGMTVGIAIVKRTIRSLRPTASPKGCYRMPSVK